jgi:hypothetical protein
LITRKSGDFLLARRSPEATPNRGRLVEKKRHNNTDTEQFEYNIRGWTTKIKSGDFEQNLLYNTGYHKEQQLTITAILPIVLGNIIVLQVDMYISMIISIG